MPKDLNTIEINRTNIMAVDAAAPVKTGARLIPDKNIRGWFVTLFKFINRFSNIIECQIFKVTNHLKRKMFFRLEIRIPTHRLEDHTLHTVPIHGFRDDLFRDRDKDAALGRIQDFERQPAHRK